MGDAFCVDIQGDSMWPTFNHGDRLTFRPHTSGEALRVGDVVVAHHPLKSDVLIVKRIARVVLDRVFLQGDHPDPLASEDSHNFGPVLSRHVVGVWIQPKVT
jgi:nickel-type superoxide dismutase maturation protease